MRELISAVWRYITFRMRFTVLFLLILSMLSCKRNKSYSIRSGPVLKVTDLQFGDVEQQFLKAENIETVYMISKNKTLNWGESDTVGRRIYNTNGQLLNESKNILGGYYMEYKYDSLGLLVYRKYSTDFAMKDYITYKFFERDRVLEQYWSWQGNLKYTFSFDDYGKVTECIATFDTTSRHHFYSQNKKFTYNKDGLLINEVMKLYGKDVEMDCVNPIASTTKYYYSNSKPDSAITNYKYASNQGWNLCTKVYFDERGLRSRSVEEDSLVTYYAYVRRGAK